MVITIQDSRYEITKVTVKVYCSCLLLRYCSVKAIRQAIILVVQIAGRYSVVITAVRAPATQFTISKPPTFTHIVVDEVEVVSRGDGHGAATPLAQSDVGLVQGLMDVDEAIDDSLAVSGRLGQLREHNREVVWTDVLWRKRTSK